MRSLFLILLVVVFPMLLKAQQVSDSIALSHNKIVELLFQSPVVDYSYDSSKIAAKLSMDGKKYKMFARLFHFTPTNFNIETENGYYVFMMYYDVQPKEYLKAINPATAVLSKGSVNQQNTVVSKTESKPVTPNSNKDNTGYPSADIQKLMDRRREIKHIGESNGKAFIYLENIAVQGDYLYFKLSLENQSSITYNINKIDFVIRDGIGAFKKSTNKEDKLQPTIFFDENNKDISSGQKLTYIIAFDKFTLKKKEKFIVEIFETNGGRSLKAAMLPRDILKAKPL